MLVEHLGQAVGPDGRADRGADGTAGLGPEVEERDGEGAVLVRDGSLGGEHGANDGEAAACCVRLRAMLGMRQ